MEFNFKFFLIFSSTHEAIKLITPGAEFSPAIICLSLKLAFPSNFIVFAIASSGKLIQNLIEFFSIFQGTKDTSPHDIPPIKLSLLISIFSIFPVLILSITHAALSGSTTIVSGIFCKYLAIPATIAPAIPPTPACNII